MEALSLFSSPVVTQLLIISVLTVSLLLFIKNRLRFDVVSLLIMIAIVVLGILPYEAVLANFGHPIIIIVASMFVLSSALVHSGIIDLIVARMQPLHTRPVLALFILMILVALISGFVNNIGALAIVIPIALHLAQKSNTPVAFFLLPLAFASHLGGYLTLIGTPRNILISNFREDVTGLPFAMFDFAYVGSIVSIAGLLFIILYAWLWLPRAKTKAAEENSRIFTTEAALTENTKKIIGYSVAQFEDSTRGSLRVAALMRDETFIPATPHSKLQVGDALLLRGTVESLTQYIEFFHLDLTGLRAVEKNVTNEDTYTTTEVLLPPYTKLHGLSWNMIPLKDRFGTNFIALNRAAHPLDSHIADTKLLGNDILLLEGRTESVQSTIQSLGLMPLVSKDAHLGQPTTLTATVTIIVGAVTLASLNIAPLAIIFLCAVVLLVVFNLISLKTMYDSIDWPVLVLLAGMLSLGEALLTSGVADTLASAVLAISELSSPILVLGLILLLSMILSDFINSTATAVIMAPIAIMVATGIGVSIDPFLMAVAIGASTAFLTPVGHESNAFVMQKGGYSFSDFTKIGLPLELLIFALSLPLILMFWPL